MMTYVAIGVLGLGALELLLAWRMVRAARRQGEAADRLVKFADALALLTETTEAGFRTMAVEMGRLAETGAARGSRPTNGKVARLAKRGRSVQEIAAEEQLSEGEVRLRLRLAQASQGRSLSGSHKEDGYGSVRAE